MHLQVSLLCINLFKYMPAQEVVIYPNVTSSYETSSFLFLCHFWLNYLKKSFHSWKNEQTVHTFYIITHNHRDRCNIWPKTLCCTIGLVDFTASSLGLLRAGLLSYLLTVRSTKIQNGRVLQNAPNRVNSTLVYQHSHSVIFSVYEPFHSWPQGFQFDQC